MDMLISVIVGAVAGFLGFWIGWFTHKKNNKSEPIGVLNIYTGDPDGVYMTLESYVIPEYIMTQKEVTLSVDVTDVSQN